MRTISVCYFMTLIISPVLAGTVNRVVVVPEQQTTLHVGQIAILHVPSKRDYVVERTGGTIIKFKHQHQKGAVLYRAAYPGNETIILTPAGLADGHCVSCVTRHYFVTVIP